MTSSRSDNSNNIKRGDPQQIPKEDVSGQVEKVISALFGSAIAKPVFILIGN
jgi:hypothetical protein